MKILQVSHGLPPRENAGVELYTYYLSQALSQKDHSVRIFCREEDPEREEFSCREEEVDGLRVTRVVNNLTRISGPRVLYDNPFFDQAFLKALRQEKPDLVHFQHFIALSANLLRIAKEEGCPVVLTLHDFFILCHRTHLLKGDDRLCPGPLYGLECASCLDFLSPPEGSRIHFFLKARETLPFPVIKWTKRFFIPAKHLGDRGFEVFHRYRYMYEMLKIPNVILTPSKFVRDLFLTYYPFIKSKVRVLPLGIFPVGPPAKLQGASKPPGGKMRFCYFGNILPLKGLHFLIDAFKRLPEGEAALTIYGDRNPWTEKYYDRLKEQASGYSVDFRPPFKRENLAEVLSEQDVVVLPSICYESFSFVVREANGLGLPVIASRIGAIPEAVQHGVNGFLFEPRDVEDLKRCMLRFVESPSLAGEMASKIPKVRMMEGHAAELSEIYQETIGKRR